MIIRRLTLGLAAAAVLATSAAIVVIALAFALYALVLPWVGPAGAAAVVAGAAALTIGLAGLLLAGAARGGRRRSRAGRADNLVERALEMVREKPVVAVGVALAVGVLTVRNPRYLGSALRAFVEGRELPPAS